LTLNINKIWKGGGECQIEESETKVLKQSTEFNIYIYTFISFLSYST